ncbi:MAG: hypothetical protein K2N95_11105 [Lachnospiraceae bacterium]|nr:hypothetical protein [Lachnospiraceae bacterium]
MRRHILSTDAFICLCLSMLIACGTGMIAGRIAEIVYEKTLEEHQPVDGEIGGRADETVFRAQSVEDLLSHDTFTIVSHGIRYRNEGTGFHNNTYLYNVELPSGERIAARVNDDSIQSTGTSIFNGDNILPLGHIIWEDLTQDQAFLHQIESIKPLTRKDFYVDMVGNTAVMDAELALETPKIVTQVLTVFIFYPIFHTIGSKLGIFPTYFVFTKKKKD